MQKNKNLFALFRWIILLTFSISPKIVTLATLSSILISILDLSQIYLFANILGEIVKLASQTNPNIELVVKLLILRLLVTTTKRILRFVQDYTNAAAYEILEPELDKILAQKIHSLKIQSLESPEIQNKIQRAQDGINSVLNFFWRSLQFIESLIKLILATLGVMGTYPLLLILSITIRIPMYFNDKYFRKKIWEIYRDNTEDRRKANESLTVLTNTKTLQEVFLTNNFSLLLNKYLKVARSLANLSISTRLKWYKRSSSINFVSEIYELFVYTFVVFQIISKAIDTTIGLVVVRLVENIDNSIESLIRSTNELQQLSVRLQDTYALFQEQPSFADGKTNFKVLTKGPAININNINFSYPNSKSNIFTDFSLSISSGEKIAIVGENGAGKTSLVKLLCRMYQVNSGEIKINNLNLNTLKIDSFYKSLGVLFQEYNIYPHLTVRENIALGLPNQKPNFAKIKQAALHAHAKAFIEALPGKYDQVLSERYKGGQRISTGQWQKLAIARFFYRNSPLVIFDEPTAAIDAVAEAKIFRRIYNFFKHKTVIIISHRFSTVRSADRIIVLDKGKIVEQGSHTQLLALNGKYAHSFNLQAKGYAN